MSTFGERLRQERECRNITLQEISESTKIVLPYLEALEGDDFGKLPGGVFSKSYVRAYAQCIGLDPERLVEAYLRAQDAGEPALAEADADAPGPLTAFDAAETAELDEPTETNLRPRRRIWLPISFAVGLVAIAGWVYLRGGRPEGTTSMTTPAPVSGQVAAEDRGDAGQPDAALPVRKSGIDPSPRQGQAATVTERIEARTEASAPTGARETPIPPEAKPTIEARTEERPPIERPVAETGSADADAPATAVGGEARLSVVESGVGARVVDHRLEDRSERFEEGTQISFWTRVVGGEAGARLRHVWLRENHVVDSIELTLGGPHWRTYSRKTLYAGSAGQWAVEARDSAGHVLARHEFTCVKTGSGSRSRDGTS